MIYFTSICANYLPKAMALAASVKRHCKDAVFVLCLVEREIPEAAARFPHFDEVVLAQDAGWENFERFVFRHSIVEASTAVKPRFMQHLMARFGSHVKFVYLDPDVRVYGDFEELRSLLDRASIVVCPHLLRPGNIDMEISSLAHGAYNLGFLALARSPNAESFLQWWADRLFRFCYDDKARGIFTDQKWMDLAPSFFDVHILKHHGYDFATWSLLGSDLRDNGAGAYVVNGDPLRFIHFSGLDSGTLEKAIGWWLTADNRDCFVRLYKDYRAALEQYGQSTLGSLPWSYANYRSGEPIAKEARLAYRDPALWARIPDPFDASNAELAACAAELGGSPAKGSVAPSTGLVQGEHPWLIERVLASARRAGVGATLVKGLRRVVGR
ncbi:MAG TPA: hypothetical protein VEY50_11335 [Lysobacter sp.]|nr:hypothetical protein [Lysobacter sp.]